MIARKYPWNYTLGNIRLHLGNVFWCFVKRFPIRLLLCDISLSEVPASTNFVHPIGIVIRNGVSFGENCIIYQNVTIGNRRMATENPAMIGNNVTIGAGATILGEVIIGDNTTIAAGSIILTNIPKDSVYICEIKGRLVNVG